MDMHISPDTPCAPNGNLWSVEPVHYQGREVYSVLRYEAADQVVSVESVHENQGEAEDAMIVGIAERDSDPGERAW